MYYKTKMYQENILENLGIWQPYSLPFPLTTVGMYSTVCSEFLTKHPMLFYLYMV